MQVHARAMRRGNGKDKWTLSVPARPNIGNAESRVIYDPRVEGYGTPTDLRFCINSIALGCEEIVPEVN
jgi:hypothetical protein